MAEANRDPALRVAREVARFLEIGAELTRAVPCWDMDFTRDPSFWEAIPALGRGAP